MKSDLNIVVFGAGAIGSTVASWLSKTHENTYILARGEALENIRYQGLIIYQKDHSHDVVSLNTIETLGELERIDVIVVCVKTYSLEAVLRQISLNTGDDPVVIGIQNGVENQTIMPRYFSKIIYGVAQHNAWLDRPGEVGFSEKTPLILGSMTGDVKQQYPDIIDIFSKAMPVIATERMKDASHNKLLANLINSILSLSGKPDNTEDLKAMHELFIHVLMESIEILESNNIGEFRMKAFPSWKVLKIMSVLPRFLTRNIFSKGIKKVQMTSMQQDVLQRGGDTELHSINGVLLSLARKTGVEAPYSQALYDVCHNRFSVQPYSTIPARYVLDLVYEKMKQRDVNHNRKIICREG